MLVIAPCPRQARPLCKASRRRHRDAMGKVHTSAGVIGVSEAGGGPAVPILFLHGVGSDKSVWHPQLAHFGRSRRAIAIDYPGYGESGARDEATRDDFAR